MRYLTCLLTIIFSVQCNNPQNGKIDEPVLSIAVLPNLVLDSLSSFWGNDSVFKSSSGVTFSSQNGYIGESVYMSKNSGSLRILSVVIFESKSAAIAAMEYRIKNVAFVFHNGNSSNTYRWWYSNGIPKTLTFSKLNTLIEVSDDRGGNSFLFNSDSLWLPVNEISHRIDNFAKENELLY